MNSESVTVKQFARNDKPFYFVGAVFADYLWIMACVVLCEMVSTWFYPLAFIIIGTRLHALSILMHERVHSTIWSEPVDRWFSQILLAGPVFLSHSNYKSNHMNHHKYLFTCQDPDHSRFHKIAGELHSASIGRKIWQVFVHLTLSVAEIKRIVAGPYKGQEVTSDKVAKRERLVSGILYACLLVLLSWFGVAHWLLLYWLLPLLIVTRTIATLRAIFEHEWSDQSGEVQKNTYNHYGSFLFEFMLFPHSINFHTTHHMYPYVPFYHIKSLTDHLQQVNGFGDSPRQTYHLRPFGSPREIRTMS